MGRERYVDNSCASIVIRIMGAVDGMNGWWLFMALVGICLGMSSFRSMAEEVPAVQMIYHNGPLLSSDIDVHVVWYGKFSPVQRSIIGDFLHSLGEEEEETLLGEEEEEALLRNQPSVKEWWKTTDIYREDAIFSMSSAVATEKKKNEKIVLVNQTLDESYSLGKWLQRTHIEALVLRASVASNVLAPEKGIFLVLTAQDVVVERFCMSSCGFHSRVKNGEGRRSVSLPYAWVGNSLTQCPGQCAWPFYQPLYGPQTIPLVAPNGDVGVDGMIINIATVLVGTVTNPFNTGLFQGDAALPLEGVSACRGMYGRGAYPGYAGQLLVDETTGASFNARGLNGRMFLLPAVWDPVNKSCKTIV